MGRHSAPDDSDEEVGTAAIALVPDAELARVIEARGRHSRTDEPGPDTDLQHTQRIAPVADAPSDSELTLDLGALIAEPADVELAPKPDKKAARAERKAARQAGRETDRKTKESDTKADLRLLRQQPAVRAQAIAAVLASFLVYTVVIIALGNTTSYLYWLWVPIVASGVLVGLVLDLAHRRVTKRDGQPSR
jgi:hypothetical protein